MIHREQNNILMIENINVCHDKQTLTQRIRPSLSLGFFEFKKPLMGIFY